MERYAHLRIDIYLPPEDFGLLGSGTVDTDSDDNREDLLLYIAISNFRTVSCDSLAIIIALDLYSLTYFYISLYPLTNILSWYARTSSKSHFSHMTRASKRGPNPVSSTIAGKRYRIMPKSALKPDSDATPLTISLCPFERPSQVPLLTISRDS